MDTLKKHVPFSGPEELNELKKIAERFEERIYTAATCQVFFFVSFFFSIQTHVGANIDMLCFIYINEHIHWILIVPDGLFTEGFT